MSDDIQDIMSLIDSIKEHISDNDYLIISNKLLGLHKSYNNLYELTIFFPKKQMLEHDVGLEVARITIKICIKNQTIVDCLLKGAFISVESLKSLIDDFDENLWSSLIIKDVSEVPLFYHENIIIYNDNEEEEETSTHITEVSFKIEKCYCLLKKLFL